MRFVSIPHAGGPEVLEVGERPDPTPGPGQVLIRTAAATVNPTDLLLRLRGAADALPPPWTPGTELAGTVAAAAEGSAFHRAQRVFAVVNSRGRKGGAQAALVVVAAASVAAIPDG